ncbi:MAG: Glutathione-binding protein GsiB [Cyanobium sp. ARS6]|nr:MAG: Glutathione-binding protein GsiB [Cyanobium sp. ARS6]
MASSDSSGVINSSRMSGLAYLRRHLKHLLPLTAALALCVSQGACQPGRRSDRITVASAGRITSLDPAQASTFGALQLLSALGDTLYKRTAQGELKPSLAEALPEISDDGRTVTIPLRKDVLFHDGTRFDAEAMAFSLRRFLEIGTLNYVVGDRITAVETPDTYQLRLRLSRPSSSLENLLTATNLTPVSPKAYENHRDRFLNDRFIGTGPYRLTSFRAVQQRLEPFKRYWGPSPSNAGLDLIYLSNSTALFGAMRSGEVDVLLSDSIDEDQRLALNRMASEGRLREGQGPALVIGYITLLSNTPPLQNPVLRQALALSLDRDLINERVSRGLRPPLLSLVPPGLPGGNIEPWPRHDSARARNLFIQAGYCNGRVLNLPFTYRSNVPADRLMALTWQAQIKRDLADCLSLQLDGVESTTVYRQLGEGAFQAVMLDWRGAYPDPEAYLAPLLSCRESEGSVCKRGEASISGSFWTTPGLESTLLRSDRSRGDDRLRDLESVERMAAAGAAYIPVWLVTPRAWSSTALATPEFDGNGQLLLARLQGVR